jgi:pyrroline-5-carboxylate reductase
MTAKTVGFIGGGRVTRIILGGLERAGQLPSRVVVSDSNSEVLAKLKERFPTIQVTPGDNQSPASQELVFIGLHPGAMSAVLEEIKPCLHPDTLLISLAPRLNIAGLSASLGGFSKIVRLIPNAPSIIGGGYNLVVFSTSLTPAEKETVASLFRALGECPEVAEDKLEAYAILTAMGPTYLWFQLNELQAIAESFGLTTEETQTGIAHMVVGAVDTMYQSGLQPAEVMDLVPVKPLGEVEGTIKGLYHAKLEALFAKLKN